jgi:hypothetical protein
MLEMDVSSVSDIYFFQDEDQEDGDGGKNTKKMSSKFASKADSKSKHQQNYQVSKW